MKILLAEDNAAFRVVLRSQLEFVGHQVVAAINGKQAFTLAREAAPDLIISDIQMPEMDGYQLCKAIRADENLTRTPFIFYTGTFTTPEDEALALSFGADLFLRKPVDLAVLLQELQQVVNNKRNGGKHDGLSVPAPESMALYQKAISRKLDKKQAESSLYKEIFNQSHDAIVVIDADDHLLTQNSSHQKMFGLNNIPADWTPAHSLGAELFGRVKDGVALAGRYSEAVSLPVDHHPDLHLEVSAFAMPDADGKTDTKVLVLRDATCKKIEENEKKILQAQLIQAQKMEVVGRLAGGIAHDFNNMLNAILGYSELALLDIPADNPAHGSVKAIYSSGEKAARLVRQLLAFSRKQVLHITPVKINQTITEINKMLTRLLGEDISIELRLRQEELKVMADASQFEQVLMNLAVNARDAMPEGGRLTIATNRVEILPNSPCLDLAPGRYISVSITDSGSGIDPQTMERIFEPFFTTKEVGKGTGLGLATVFGIIKQHQGHISVESHPGLGTTFTIFLPEAPAVSAGADQAQFPNQALIRGGETILLVEDDTSSRTLLCRVLEQSGYTVLSSGDGVDAITRINERTWSIDLLLTDVILPGQNGRLVAEAYAANYPKGKVLFMSGYTDDILSPYNLHRVNFIQKPFSPLALTVRIRQVLDGTNADLHSMLKTPRSGGDTA